MLVFFVSLTLFAAAQSSVTISISSGSAGCCPTVDGIRLYVVDGSCTPHWVIISPIPSCGTPVTYNASSLCSGCTDIISAQAAIAPHPPITQVGDNPAPCAFGPYNTAAGGGGGGTGYCQWEATWQYTGGSLAVFTIHT